jgi:EmrB/QacA subfamily drug resistance transporter
MEILILFRAIQGIGAGALNPVTFTIIADVFSFEQRAKVQGLVSSMWGIAGIFGPLVGGFLVDFISWHWVFFINIPFGLVSMWMIGRHFKETLEKRKRKIDVWGALTFTVGMTAFLFAMLSADTEAGYDVSRPVLFGLYAAAFVFLAIFVFIQKNHEEPMMPLYLFKNRNVAIANAASFLNSAILIGLTAYLPLWTQRVLEMGATASGFTLMPLCIGWLFGSMLCAALLKRLGTKGIAVLGVALIALGTITLAGISISTPLWAIAFCILLCGHGFGLSFTVFTLVIQSSVPLHNRGSAGSLNSLLRTLGQTIGVAVLGTALNAYLPVRIAEGLHAVFFLSAAIGIASLSITLWIPKQSQEQIERQLS